MRRRDYYKIISSPHQYTLSIRVVIFFSLSWSSYPCLYRSLLVLIPLLLLVAISGALLLFSSPPRDLLFPVYSTPLYHLAYHCINRLLLVLIPLILLFSIISTLLRVLILLILPRFWWFWSTISDTKNYAKGSTSNIITIKTDKLLYILHTKIKFFLSISTNNHKQKFNNFP